MDCDEIAAPSREAGQLEFALDDLFALAEGSEGPPTAEPTTLARGSSATGGRWRTDPLDPDAGLTPEQLQALIADLAPSTPGSSTPASPTYRASGPPRLGRDAAAANVAQLLPKVAPAEKAKLVAPEQIAALRRAGRAPLALLLEAHTSVPPPRAAARGELVGLRADPPRSRCAAPRTPAQGRQRRRARAAHDGRWQRQRRRAARGKRQRRQRDGV